MTDRNGAEVVGYNRRERIQGGRNNLCWDGYWKSALPAARFAYMVLKPGLRHPDDCGG
jgi:hypothetical protein